MRPGAVSGAKVEHLTNMVDYVRGDGGTGLRRYHNVNAATRRPIIIYSGNWYFFERCSCK